MSNYKNWKNINSEMKKIWQKYLRKIRAGTENWTRIVASTGPQDNLYPTPAMEHGNSDLKQPIKGVFLYKLFAEMAHVAKIPYACWLIYRNWAI